MTRPLNHAAAIANACDEYAEDARQYEGATQDRIDRDLLEIENLARLIIGLTVNSAILVGRTEFAQVPARKYPLSVGLIDAFENEMTPAAHTVLAAMVAKQESEK